MGNDSRSAAISVSKDGKYHDGTFRVEGDRVSVLYWGRDGVTRCEARAEDPDNPEQTASQLLSQIIDTHPQLS